MDYLKLIFLPSTFIDRLGDKKPSFFLILTIWLLAAFSMTLPNIVLFIKANSLGLVYIPVYAVVLIIMYFPFVYGFSYFYWMVGKGFKGSSKFIEIRNLFVFSIFPFILYLPVSIAFLIISLANSDKDMINQQSYITQVVLWFLSFRILIIGIAKYNKFNWAIALANWFIVVFVVGGIYYLIRH